MKRIPLSIGVLLIAFVTASCRSVGETPSPKAVGRKLAERILSQDPESFYEKGAIHYAVVNTWVAALEYARLAGDRVLEERLIAKFDPFMPGGARHSVAARAKHVDHAVFGTLPLEIAILNGDAKARAFGLKYADGQWSAPAASDIDDFPPHIRGHFVPLARQVAYFERGYTPQTRLWIDDMYMINALQTQAYRATGDGKYLDRAAKEMRLYLDRLQLESGLFNHAEGIPFRWARGDGWMAAGMPLLLRHLDRANPDRPAILAGYRKMMATLLGYQRADGFWTQLVDDPESWPESSGTAMFAYGMLEGVRNGWLEREPYLEPALRAYRALVGSLEPNGDLPKVCVGTNAKNDRAWYLGRATVTGDPHGQAPLLWIVNTLLTMDV